MAIPSRYIPRFWPLALLLALLPGSALAQQADPAPDQLQREIDSRQMRQVTLYRGASSENAFNAAQLKPVESERALVQAIASRLMSTSAHVTGLTSNPQTAGAFALGVKDGQPSTVNNSGLTQGFVGVTKAKVMSPADFNGLIQQCKTPKSLNTLLGLLAKNKVVVDASGLVGVLADRHRGIFTSGYQEMIASALSREAEYLVFGTQPIFNRVVPIAKSDVVDTSGSITHPAFNTKLGEKLNARPTRPADRAATGATTKQMAAQLTRTSATTTRTTVKPVAKARTLPGKKTKTTRRPTLRARVGAMVRRVFKPKPRPATRRAPKTGRPR